MFKGDRIYIFGEKREYKKVAYIEKYGDFEYIATHENQISRNSRIIFERMINEGTVNTMIFPSAASIRKVVEALEPNTLQSLLKLRGMKYICFGETSNKEAIANGFTVDEVLQQPSIEELVSVLSKQKLVTLEGE